MSKNPRPNLKEKALREALVPLAVAGVTADQANTLIWASVRGFQQGSSIDHTRRLWEILTETFPDNPPTRPCHKDDITFNYTNDDDGLHLHCDHCNTNEAIGGNQSLDELAAVATAHVAQSKAHAE